MEQFKNKTLEEIWTALGDIPVTDNMEIEIPFLVYPAGTECTEIWLDIEEYYNISIGEYQFKH